MSMKLKKIISGGQTGADQAGLWCAALLGLETGGWAPKGWKTEEGWTPWLAEYGLKEHASSNYAPRTHANAKDGDVTLWFGNTGSPGYWCTVTGCKLAGKLPPVVNPNAIILRELAERYEIWNIAGNRRSTNPLVEGLVLRAFRFLPQIKELSSNTPLVQ